MKVNSFFTLIIGILISLFFVCQSAYSEVQTIDRDRQELESQINNPYYKFVEKLNDAKAQNIELKRLYDKFGEKGLSTSDREKIIDEFLYKLAKAENIEESSRGNYINAKHLAVIELYMDKEFISTSPDKVSQVNPKNPNIVAGAILESIYEQLKAFVYAEFASELLIKDLIATSSVYLNLNSENLEWHFDEVIKKLDDELKNNPKSAKERIYNFGAWAKGLGYFGQKSFFNPFDDDCFYTHFTKNDRELKWQIDSIGKIPYDLNLNDPSKQGDEAVRAFKNTALIDFHARRGDDVVYGDVLDDRFIVGTGDDLLDGGDGNDELYGWAGNDIIWGGNGDDTIYAGEGNDIIFAGDGKDVIYPDHQDYSNKNIGNGNDIINAGKGNDKIYSLYGDDTYIFNIGDGHDIIEDKYGNDTIYFGKGITIKDIKHTKFNNDLLLNIKDDENSITVKKYYKKYKLRKNKNLYKIEYLQFGNTKKILFSDLIIE